MAHGEGGSRSYVKKLVATAGFNSRIGEGVASLKRTGMGVEIVTSRGQRGHFDAVVCATHTDQALALIDDASADERVVLGGLRYAENEVILHCDPRLMPKRKRAWAAWNVLRASGEGDRPVMVSYWMNRLQGIDEKRPLFVTLNPRIEPSPDLVFGRFSYAHPQYDASALAAQRLCQAFRGAVACSMPVPGRAMASMRMAFARALRPPTVSSPRMACMAACTARTRGGCALGLIMDRSSLPRPMPPCSMSAR